MAIKNLIKTDTYSRLSGMEYTNGSMRWAKLVCYTEVPDYTFKELMTEVDGEYPEETTEVLHEFVFDAQEFSDVTIDAKKNIHKQVYEHLMSLSLCEGCESDE